MNTVTALTLNEIFDKLMDVMTEDNGFQFEVTPEHRARAITPIFQLQLAGYFADDPNDLDGSFWMMGAGEYSEAPEYFSRAPEAFDQLSAVLNDIFNGE